MSGKNRKEKTGMEMKMEKGASPVSPTRSERQKDARCVRRGMWDWKLKKGLMAVSAFFFIVGLCSGDLGYSEMMGEEGKIIPSLRRIDEETIAVSAFGTSIFLNTEQMEVQILSSNFH